jgi:hypothetical protein
VAGQPEVIGRLQVIARRRLAVAVAAAGHEAVVDVADRRPGRGRSRCEIEGPG